VSRTVSPLFEDFYRTEQNKAGKTIDLLAGNPGGPCDRDKGRFKKTV